MTENNLVFLVSTYYATGEGRTVSILITKAYPLPEDYDTPPSFDTDESGNFSFVAGTLKHSKEFIAIREFATVFDGWLAQGVQCISKEEFIKNFTKYVPEIVIKMLDEPAGNFHYHSQFTVNFS